MFEKNPDNCIDVTAGGAAALADDDFASAGESASSAPEISTPPKSDKRGYVKSSELEASDLAFLAPELTSEAEGPIQAPARADGRWGYRFVKRAFDIAFSLCVIIVVLIPVALLCLVVRLESSGSPIYLQKRVGYLGKPLRILKLRTMVVDSDDVEKHLSPEQLEQWERERKVNDDPRITRVGRFLRRTSLDELPQFLNVLAGQMSVIGPRPVVEDELAAYGSNLSEFLSVKPGITGWWQVQARNDAAYEDGSRQELELYYVRNASLALDASVFFETFRAVFGGTGR